MQLQGALGNVREQFGPFDGLYEALEKAAALIAIHGKRMPIEINDGTKIQMGAEEIHTWCNRHSASPQSK